MWHIKNKTFFCFQPTILAVLVLIFVFLFTVKGINSVNGVFSFWGYGDAQMLNAAINFANDGFLNHHFLPLVNPGSPHNLIENNGPNGRYFHYPALHATLLGFIFTIINFFQKINQLDPESLKNIAQSCFSLISLFGMYIFFTYIKKSTNSYFAFFSLILFLFSGWYANFGYSLCDQPLAFLFLVLDLYVIQKIINYQIIRKIRSPLFDLTLIFFICFFASMNSIETPIILFFVNTFSLLYFRYHKNKEVSLLPIYLTFISIFIALSLHFFQGFLEFDSLDLFFKHWHYVATNKFNPIEVGSLSLIIQSIQSVPRYFLLFSTLCLITLIKICQKPFSNSLLYISAVLTLAYFLSISILFFLIPKQMLAMSPYSIFYIYQATFMAASISLYYYFYKAFQKKLCKWNLTLGLAIALFSIIYFCAQVSKLHKGPLFRSIFDGSQNFAMYGDRPKGFLTKVGVDRLSELRLTTSPNSLLITPIDLSGNSTLETISFFEFYTQRHSIPFVFGEDANFCLILNKRIFEIGDIYILDNKLKIRSKVMCN